MPMSTERNPGNAAPTEPTAPNEGAEIARVRALTEQLRCLVCQNQTIADSNAGLAIDLRQQVVQQVRAGRSDTEIKQYMVERYGDFVLYDPPFSTTNSVLWVGPFVLLALGLLLVWRSVLRRRRSPDAPSQPSADQHAQLQILEARYQASTTAVSAPRSSRPKDSASRQTRE
jgi:cytochrome c-type biogenesis protein CcmH